MILVDEIGEDQKKIMKEVILQYFVVLRGVFEILEGGEDEEIKK